MRLSKFIAETCRKPQFQVPLFSALIAAAGVSVADTSANNYNDGRAGQDSSVQSSQYDSKSYNDMHKSNDMEQGANTDRNVTASDRSATSEQSRQKNPSFSQVDADQDNKLIWTEIYAIYDDELDDAKWDESSVYSNYDKDRNSSLSDQEYIVFITDLRATPGNKDNAQAKNSQQSMQERQEAARQVQASTNDSQTDMSSQQNQQASSDQSRQQEQARTQAQAQSKDKSSKYTDPKAVSDSNPVSVMTVTTITSIPVESLKDMEVINNQGEEIGEVEHVLTDDKGNISGLVVGVGGFWDIGDKDVRVDAEQLQISGNYIIWNTSLDEDQLDNLPEYKGDEVSVAY